MSKEPRKKPATPESIEALASKLEAYAEKCHQLAESIKKRDSKYVIASGLSGVNEFEKRLHGYLASIQRSVEAPIPLMVKEIDQPYEPEEKKRPKKKEPGDRR